MAFVFFESMFLIFGIIKTNAADKNNVIINVPHAFCQLTAEEWDKPYSRTKAAFPQPCSKADKYWPPVTKIDDAFGDRNLVCTCYLNQLALTSLSILRSATPAVQSFILPIVKPQRGVIMIE